MNYPHSAKRFIREAKNSLDIMKTTNSIDELKRAHVSFLNSANFSTQQLLTSFGSEVGFSEYWKPKAEFMNKNELFKFFRVQRNNVTKAGEDPIMVNYYIGELTLKGPLEIGSNGILVLKESENGRKEIVPHETDSLIIKSWDFKSKPITYNSISAIKMCEEYLTGLEKIIDDAANDFGEGSM